MKFLTCSCKDDWGGHPPPLARPRSTRSGGVTVAAEEAAISEDKKLQGTVWGLWGSQGSWQRREQTGRQLN